MFREKILKTLFRKFKWSFFGLFLLVFLVNYLIFLNFFNFRQNLSYDAKRRGWFYFLFGKYSVIHIQEVQGTKIYVDWNKLLFILFLLYFPFRIVIQSILDYFQGICQRQATVFLTKNLLNFAYKHKGSMTKNLEEKIYIVNHFVPIFCQQFFSIPIKIFDIFVDLFFDFCWLYFLIKSNELFNLTPFVFAFFLINFICLILFRIFTSKSEQSQVKREVNYQEVEEDQIKNFFKNLDNNIAPADLKKAHKLLDKNSRQFSSLRFVSLFLSLPYLIIPGLHLLFLLLYYKVFLGGKGGLEWDLYFVALGIRSIFLVVRRTFEFLPNISSFLKNYKRVRSFFD